MILKPLLPDQFDCLKPLLEERLKESGLSKLSNPDYVLKRVKDLYSIRSAGAYVDDFRNPKHCLIMTHFPSMLIDDITASISLIYTRPEFRGNPEDVEVLYSTAENYARLNGAKTITGSSWLLGGGKRDDKPWNEREYALQSVSYIKML